MVAMDKGPMTYRDGEIYCMLLEAAVGRDLITFIDGNQSWRVDGFQSILPPSRSFMFQDELVFLLMMLSIYEESGLERGRMLFKGQRIGGVMQFSPDSVLVPQINGIEKVFLGEDVQQPEF